MLLDLSRLRGGVERLERRLEPEDFAGSDDFRVISPVLLTGEVRRDGDKVRMKGRLEATLECACSRCLDPFAVPVGLDLDLLFLPTTAVAGSGSKPSGTRGRHREDAPDDEDEGDAVADDDLGVSFYTNDELDVTGIIREQFYLTLPMKPLCRQDCRGLCPVCGINRNRETCTCRIEWVDPRLEPLKHLRRGS
jgi:uncharacterized protein